MTTTTAAFLRLATASLLSATLATATDWNQWRGPNRDGVATGFTAPAAWTADSLVKKWSVTVGEGHASPVVVGERVYVFSREGEKETLRCLALADGKLLWRAAYDAPYEMNPAARGHGMGPKATPAVVEGRVFTLGISGQLAAFDANTGAVLWRKSFTESYKSTAPVFGAATSPLVDGKNVIVHVGGEDGGALTAFDTATGKVNWQWTGDGPAYTSPIIATLGGVRQLITQSQKRCIGVSPVDGKVLWEIPFTTPYDQNIVTPIVSGDVVIFGGIRKPMTAVKVTGNSATTVWEAREITMYMSSPVVDGAKIYGMSDKFRGTLFTLDAANGTVLWKSDGTLGSNASVTDVGPALLVLNDAGELTVQQKAGNALKELIKYKVADSPVWASPAVVGNQLLIKDQQTVALHLVGGRKSGAGAGE